MVAKIKEKRKHKRQWEQAFSQIYLTKYDMAG